ncbi:MAG: DUF1577 domain-containing protein [Leptospiraceae bacterium]|nr:DUF1577 domain-containing protein [Leptospiraceae bacterium]
MDNNTIERKKRDLFEVKDQQKLYTIFSRFLMNTEINVQETRKGKFKAKFVGFSEDCKKITLEIFNSTLVKGLKVSMNKFIGRYITIEGFISGVAPGSLFIIDVEKLVMAQKSRGSNRIHPPKELVYANNFRVTRASFDMDSFTVPAYVKITFNDYENRLLKKFDKIHIDFFRPGLDEKFFLVKSTCKTIYIRNTQDPKSYSTNNEEDFINCEEEFLDDIDDMIKDFRNKKIISEIIMPVIYINSGGDVTSIGYVQIHSTTKFIEFDDLMAAKLLTFEMVDRIRDSNTLVYTQKAEIINLSPDGLKLKLSDRELKQQIPHVKGFTMDIVFKMQSPINVSVLVRNISKQLNDDLHVGLEIDGFRVGDKARFKDNFEDLFKHYRSK